MKQQLFSKSLEEQLSLNFWLKRLVFCFDWEGVCICVAASCKKSCCPAS